MYGLSYLRTGLIQCGRIRERITVYSQISEVQSRIYGALMQEMPLQYTNHSGLFNSMKYQFKKKGYEKMSLTAKLAR